MRYHSLKHMVWECVKKKEKSRSGETIAETLVTMLVLSLAVLILAGAVVSSAKVRQKTDVSTAVFITDGQIQLPANITVTDTGGASGSVISIPVCLYHTENDYVYYEPIP